jgi:hypothetical protein
MLGHAAKGYTVSSEVALSLAVVAATSRGELGCQD